MNLRDFMNQLEASAELTVNDEVEVVVVDEDSETCFPVYEVSYNKFENKIEIHLSHLKATEIYSS